MNTLMNLRVKEIPGLFSLGNRSSQERLLHAVSQLVRYLKGFKRSLWFNLKYHP